MECVTAAGEPLCCYRLPLEGMKRKVLRNLRLLESDNLVSSSDDYQDIINAIAKVYTTNVFICFSNNFTQRIYVINIDTDSSVNRS